MASGDRPPAPSSHPLHRKSWAQIASSINQHTDNSPLHNATILNKLKESTTDFIRLDRDLLNRAHLKFQHALYGKLFGKSPPFEQVKADLLAKWSMFGEILISDLPNGFLLIRCPSQQVMEKLLLDGPWTVNGIILQISPWKPFFEPTFAKLNTAAIWLQLHNLPVELWEGETLETIVSQFGTLLKVDDFTVSMSRSKYARVCVEIDLSKPLCRGFWIGDDMNKVFVVVMYERLPTFCYTCGMVGHGSSSCSRSATSGAGNPVSTRPVGYIEPGPTLVSGGDDQIMDIFDPVPDRPLSETTETTAQSPIDSDYGPWLLVTRRRGSARGRGGGTRASRVTPSDAVDPGSEAERSRGSNFRSTHGGKSFAANGRHTSSQIKLSAHAVDEQLPALIPNNPPAPFSIPNVHIEPSKSQDIVLPSQVTSPPSFSNQITPLHLSPTNGKGINSSRSKSPPPDLRSSVSPPRPFPPINVTNSHFTLVDKISNALKGEDMEEDASQDEDYSDEDDEDMSDEEDIDEEPEDSMTLVQYQAEARHEALVQKGSIISDVSPKKGRVKLGGPSS